MDPMEGHRRVCCHLLSAHKEGRRASSPLHTWGPSTKGLSSPAYSAGCLCLCGSGPSPAAIWQPQPPVWHSRPAYAAPTIDEMRFNSSGPFPAGIVLMETASEMLPFAASNPWSSAKLIVRSFAPNRPLRVAAPPFSVIPQHPPILIQVKAGGKWQILST